MAVCLLLCVAAGSVCSAMTNTGAPTNFPSTMPSTSPTIRPTVVRVWALLFG